MALVTRRAGGEGDSGVEGAVVRGTRTQLAKLISPAVVWSWERLPR